MSEPNHRALPERYLTKSAVAELRKLAMFLCVSQALDASQIVAFIVVVGGSPALSVERRDAVPDKFLVIDAPGSIRVAEVRRGVWESIEKQDAPEHLRILMIDESAPEGEAFVSLLVRATDEVQ